MVNWFSYKFLFSIIKTRAVECVSVVNQKCISRPKILDVNEGVGEALFYPYNVLVNVMEVVHKFWRLKVIVVFLYLKYFFTN